MAKKSGKPRKRKRAVKPNTQTNQANAKVEAVLIENFVSLQHVMTNIAIKMDNLSGQISRLLELFEVSAKTLAEKGLAGGTDMRVAAKLDSLIEQNKVLARGIALIHEKESTEPGSVIPGAQPQAELSKNPRFRTMNV